jgi:actin-related protein 5
MVTGSPSQIPGLIPRLHNTLRPILPPETPINVWKARDPVFDAWKGMATFAKSDYFREGKASMTAEQYFEEGGERIKRWWGSNWHGGMQNDAYVHEWD